MSESCDPSVSVLSSTAVIWLVSLTRLINRTAASTIPDIFGMAEPSFTTLIKAYRDKQLPTFAAETFEDWFRNNRHALGVEPAAGEVPAGKVALFDTCFVNYNNPEVGKATVELQSVNGEVVATAESDSLGRFRLEFEDGGRFRLRVLRHDPTAAPVETSWFSL